MEGRSVEVEAGDGRRLRARLTGPEDGQLLIFLPGTPCTETVHAGQIQAGADRGIAHLCCLRPGYGGSDRLPGRTVGSVAADVAALADAVGAESFYVLGHSGGAPHALACAALLAGRVRAAAAISGLAPPREVGKKWREGVATGNLEELDAAASDEASQVRIIERYLEEWGRIETIEELRESFRAFYSGNDWEALQAEGNLGYQLESIHQIAREEVWGWLDDDRATIADWGFAAGRD